jgi:aminoglycoside phosphotransferase (APT) family kinase protein
VPWLAAHQLARRIADTDAAGGLDWAAVPLDPVLRVRLADAWAARHDLLAPLAAVPETVCHGDFHAWNLLAGPTGDLVVLDWGGLGVAPLGADLAHLALSEPGSATDRLREPYLAGLAAAGARVDPRAVLLGYCVTAGLTGVARTHWSLSREPDAALDDYAEWSLARIAEARALAAARS